MYDSLLAEARSMIRYFLNANIDFLHGMGVDPAKLPSEEDWLDLLREDFARPPHKRQFYYVVWEADGVPVGHCNINKIEFGEAAFTHLHGMPPGLQGLYLLRRKGAFFG